MSSHAITPYSICWSPKIMQNAVIFFIPLLDYFMYEVLKKYSPDDEGHTINQH